MGLSTLTVKDIVSLHNKGIYEGEGNWLCVTTNGTVKNNGKAVMGKGIAKQIAYCYPFIPDVLGNSLSEIGNRLVILDKTCRLIAFPVKHNWWKRADLNLIRRSCEELKDLIIETEIKDTVYLPRPGCGNGQLNWETEVRPVINEVLGDIPQVLIVDKNAR